MSFFSSSPCCHAESSQQERKKELSNQVKEKKVAKENEIDCRALWLKEGKHTIKRKRN
jgi:hypothetical protein